MVCVSKKWTGLDGVRGVSKGVIITLFKALFNKIMNVVSWSVVTAVRSGVFVYYISSYG